MVKIYVHPVNMKHTNLVKQPVVTVGSSPQLCSSAESTLDMLVCQA